MERIRGRADQMRGLTDTAKAVRMGLADRRHSLDIQDKVSCSSVFFCRLRAKLLDQKVLGLFPGSDTKCQCI